jgi:hypothetical protein
MLFGEKRGRLNLAEFRYGWLLARATWTCDQTDAV